MNQLESAGCFTHLVRSQPLVDEAHFSQVLHTGRHAGQHVHQLHDAQLTLVFLRSDGDAGEERKEKAGMKKICSSGAMTEKISGRESTQTAN